MTRIFISHSSRDKDIARRLAKDLRRARFHVWFDEWEIVIGDSITQRISAGLENADFVVVLLSEHSVSSGWVEKEWHSKIGVEATNREVVILPALVDQCHIPPLLLDKRHANLASSYTAGLAELIAALREHTLRRVRIQTGNAVITSRSSRPATLLIVDDEGRHVEELRRTFQAYGNSLTILTARDAGEGFIQFQKSLPDAVILDIMMPYGTARSEIDGTNDVDMLDAGLRLLERIRKDYPDHDFWCAVVTGRASRPLIARLQELLADNVGRIYLKPYNAFQLEYDLTSSLGIPCRLPTELLDEMYPGRGNHGDQ